MRAPALHLLAAWTLALTALAGPSAGGTGAGYASRDLEGVWTNQTATRLERPKEYAGLVATPAEMQARAQRQAAAKARGDKPKAAGSKDGDVGQGESEFGDKNEDLTVIGGRSRTSVVTDPADGHIPFTPEGERRLAQARAPHHDGLDNPEERPVSERCVAEASQAGPPLMSGPDDANFQIVLTPDRVAVLSELIHQVRVARVGGVHPVVRLHAIQGDAIARWEGDTLVIDTVDQNTVAAERKVDNSIFFVSPQARVVERLRRISPTEILYGFTVEDPALYRRPWSGEMVLRRVDKPIFEYACHEGNYALVNILSGAREQEKRGAAPPPRS